MLVNILGPLALAALAGANSPPESSLVRACNPKTPITTVTTSLLPTSAPTDSCSSRTVCFDYVNECGIKYGGCFPDCKPYPTFSKPPCPSATSITDTTTAVSPTSTQDNCSTRTICIDYVNECGMMYGGCIPDCLPYPTFSKPPCPSTTTTSTTTVTPTSSPDDCSTRSICFDYVNECGIWYGGCVPDCKPYPTFSKPPCPSTTTTSTAAVSPTSTQDSCSSRTICIDYVNECGMGYGGCIPDCKPYPTFSKPPCPTTSTFATSTRSAAP